MADDRDDIPLEVKDFFEERQGASDEVRNRQDFLDDLRFVYVPGAQWDENARRKRQGRPCYSYNRTAGAVNQLVGDQRMAQIGGKVRPTNKKAALGTAETFGGLIRDIEAQSHARTVYAEAFKYATAGAWGVWRIVPEYADDESFDQVLRVRRVANPLTVYFDGQADPFGRGGVQCVVAERISRIRYDALYPRGSGTNVDVSNDSQGWFSDDEIRVAEYYKMRAETRQLALLSDGRAMPYDDELLTMLADMKASNLDVPDVVRKRTVKAWVCTWWKVDGRQVLEGPIEYRYRHIPVVRVPGRHVNIEGESYFQSLIRHGKDAARTYNYDRSSMVETTALQPRAPYLLTQKMIAGYEDMWERSNTSNSPFLLYNPDEDFPELHPKRERGPEVPQAFIALAAHDAEDIRQTIGYTNPAVEQQTRAGDAESGRALRTRLSAGDSGSYEFLDNFAMAVEYSWEICCDMIPVHYDTQRIERILGPDGREDFIELNPEELRKGKFDCTVTLGPAYATARMEALDTLLEASERIPMVAEEAPDIIISNVDVRGADEIERRIRMRLIREGRIQPTEEEKAAMPPAPPPDPTQVALKDRLNAQTAKDRAAAAKTTVETAERVAEANSAERREQLELAQMVQDIAKSQAEIKLLLKELTAPRETP